MTAELLLPEQDLAEQGLFGATRVFWRVNAGRIEIGALQPRDEPRVGIGTAVPVG
jgi:hypothetical protein